MCREECRRRGFRAPSAIGESTAAAVVAIVTNRRAHIARVCLLKSNERAFAAERRAADRRASTNGAAPAREP